MKKIIYVFLLLICLFLVSCDNGNDKEKDNEEKEKMTETKELDLVVGEEIDFVINDGEKITNTTSLDFSNSKLKATEAGNFSFIYETDSYIYTYNVSVIYETLTIKKTEYVLLTNATTLLDYTTNSKSYLNFSSSNINVATVDENGVIKATGIGTCTIDVLTPYNKKTVEVEVLDTKNTCTINENVIEMEVGKPQYLLIDESSNKNEGVSFTCEQKILEVSKHGIITPVRSGTEKIIVKDSKGVTREMTVNVIEKFEEVNFDDETKVNVYGRTKVSENNELIVYHSCSGFECMFEGTYFKATIESNCSIEPYGYLKIYLDDTEYSIGLDKKGKAEYVIAEGLEDKVHTIKVLKRYEESMGKVIFSDLKAELFITPPKKPELKMEVYGDSYTAGYGVLGKSTDTHSPTTDDATLSYAYVASQKLNAQLNVCCYSGISIGIPGWIKDFFLPDIAPYYASNDKTEWNFNNYQADIIVVYLGTNDNYGLGQGFGTATQFQTRYKAFVSYLLEKTPNAKIICCYGFSSMNSALETTIKNMPKYYSNSNPNQVFTFKLPGASLTGTNGHPNAASQVKGGEKLAEYITSTILPLINESEDND